MKIQAVLVLTLLLACSANADIATADEVAAHVREMADACKSVKGIPSGPDVEHGRFPHGPEFFAINDDTFMCAGAPALYSTNHGAGVTVFVSTPDGQVKEAFNHVAFGLVIEPIGNASKVWVGVGGPLCGQKGTGHLSTAEMQHCDRPLRWNPGTQTVDFAPLRKIRPIHR